jgi:hypothetical protein
MINTCCLSDKDHMFYNEPHENRCGEYAFYYFMAGPHTIATCPSHFLKVGSSWKEIPYDVYLVRLIMVL